MSEIREQLVPESSVLYQARHLLEARRRSSIEILEQSVSVEHVLDVMPLTHRDARQVY